WDGLKGYRTNTDLPADQVYDNYQQLWNVERAFRITKGTLEVRPMFHFSEKRIEAHVCICFVALKVYKELERLLKISGCPYSVDNVLRIAEVIVTIEVDLPENGKTLTKTIYTSKEERDIAYLIETDDWLNKNG
ncbi:MAG: transposase, partial [Bacteroidales bacterium]|nr:transposase [Bacteroidales bacterium]